jgi:hypothetical protein
VIDLAGRPLYNRLHPAPAARGAAGAGRAVFSRRSTMMRGTILRWVAVAALLAGVARLGPVRAAEGKKDDGFKPLFNGTDFTGLKFELGKSDPEKTFSVKEKVIVVSGRPNGYFYTDKSYKNYVLRFDWQYKRPSNLTDDSKFNGNSGALIHIQTPHRVWPECVEVQGLNKDHGHIFAIGNQKGDKHPSQFKSDVDNKTRQAAQKKAIKKVGEWNTTEITCKDGSISSKINGVAIDSGKGNLMEGQIGFQSEGAEIHFRNIMIKEMK